jgi:hypothetical protein
MVWTSPLSLNLCLMGHFLWMSISSFSNGIIYSSWVTSGLKRLQLEKSSCCVLLQVSLSLSYCIIDIDIDIYVNIDINTRSCTPSADDRCVRQTPQPPLMPTDSIAVRSHQNPSRHHERNNLHMAQRSSCRRS